MKFNQRRLVQLLKKYETLEKADKFLDPIERYEYRRNLIYLQDFVFWQSREKYLKIVKSFLSEEIEGSQLSKQFMEIRFED